MSYDQDKLARMADKRDDRQPPTQRDLLNRLERACGIQNSMQADSVARTTHERGVARPDHAPARNETQGCDSAGDDVPCSKCGAALDTGLECTECGHDMAPQLTGAGSGPVADAAVTPMRQDYESAQHERSEAWLAVVRTLNVVCPDWSNGSGVGMDKACLAIRKMAGVKRISEERLFELLQTCTETPPKRLPDGYIAFARAIEAEIKGKA